MAESDGIESNMVIVDFSDQIELELSEEGAWLYRVKVMLLSAQ